MTAEHRGRSIFAPTKKSLPKIAFKTNLTIMNTNTRLLGTEVEPGVSLKNLGALYVVTFGAIMFGVSVNAIQPFLLSTFLELRVSDHGEVTGLIGLVNEIVILIAVGMWGTLSDRFGRRRVILLGYLFIALGFALMPLSRSLWELLVFRGVYAVGIAAVTGVMIVALADYVVNRDRGKANAISGVMAGLGASVGAMLLAKLPNFYIDDAGMNGIESGWKTYFTIGALALVFAVVAAIGLQGRKRDTSTESQANNEGSLLSQFNQALSAAKDDLGVRLAYCAAFVARADLAVAGLFFPLWISKYFQAALASDATKDQLDTVVTQAIAEGGVLIAIIGGSGLLFAPVIGVLCDRIHRVYALAFALFLNVVGYALTALVVDPTGTMMKIAAVVIGCGQVAGTISSQVLVQQQAAASNRGTVIGAFGVFGAFGIMVCSWVGGILFDDWREAGPFLFIAAANMVVVIFALAAKSGIDRQGDRFASQADESFIAANGDASSP